MPISSFARPPARRSWFSWANFKALLLMVIVATIIFLMLKPLPQSGSPRYQITKIQVVAHPV